MKLNLDGSLHEHSAKRQKQLNEQVGQWTGDRDQVREYYARVAYNAAEDLKFRRAAFARWGDAPELNETIQRLEALAEEMRG